MQASFDFGSVGTSRVLGAGSGPKENQPRTLQDLELELKFKEDNINDLIDQVMQRDTKIVQLEDLNEGLETATRDLRRQLQEMEAQLARLKGLLRDLYGNLPESRSRARNFLFE